MTRETAARPRRLRPDLWIFPPNRLAAGATAWLLLHADGPVLIDPPAAGEHALALLDSLAAANGRILLTSRLGHAGLAPIQAVLDWPVLVQEQEAYLLPGNPALQPFAEELALAADLRLHWAQGPTPGSCVLHAGGPHRILFCGRLLLPAPGGELRPVAGATTFHWPRQLRSLRHLSSRLADAWPLSIASGGASVAAGADPLVPCAGPLPGTGPEWEAGCSL
ncbi:MBL fold metallo-hydrolase [Synechococcus sp. RSCCF101]|uniref:MBL fold metallo-hydrolase n=1 Tax=Synechococcus sp. RSCCF101 TaxID=2511069 RepID=UPI001246420A|nr:MBL fold metallo-hydrolase [Synechococcus sp. RSCCF101]QEY31045.1 MBL fold metallo-hydrolase [Synechococcus sp. RSCCF101]